LGDLPAQDRIALEEICYNAPEPYRTILFANMDKVKILGTEGIGDSSMSVPGGFGIFIDTSDTTPITVNGVSMPRWYSTLFHEIGHSIDYATDASKVDGVLNATIRSDVEDQLKQLGLNYSTNQSDIDKAVSKILAGNKIEIIPTDPQKLLQLNIQLDMTKILKTAIPPFTPPDYTYSGISDTYGGVTKNAIEGEWSHKNYYWYIPFISPGLETFADNFSDGVLDYKDKRIIQDTYLPKTSALLNGDPNDPLDRGMLGNIYDESKERLKK
jgi:hypothetical protein